MTYFIHFLIAKLKISVMGWNVNTQQLLSDQIVSQIIKKYFNLDSLVPKNLDREDFIEVHVSILEDALKDAIECGYNIKNV